MMQTDHPSGTNGSREVLLTEMDSVRKAFAMPVLQTGVDDFGLSSSEVNQLQLQRLLVTPYTVLQENENVLLGVALHPGTGEVFLCKKDEPALTFYVRFEIEQIEPLGTAATKVVLWRRSAPGLEQATSHVMNYLLDGFDAVVSDTHITAAGRRFWLDRMAESHARGLVTGSMDGDIPLRYDGKRPLLEWVQFLYDWSNKDGSEPRCFYISNKAG